MALRDLLTEFKKSVLATARGIGIGGSLGLIKYPAASTMVLVDKLMADNPQLTFDQALDAINQQQARDRAERPLAAYGSEIAGALVPGVALARTATTIPAAIGGGVAQGALSGFNEAQQLQDAGIGAVAGGVLAPAGMVAGKAQEAVVRRTAQGVGQQRVNETRAAINEQARQLADVEKAQEVLVRSVRTGGPFKTKLDGEALAAKQVELDALKGDAEHLRRSIGALRASQKVGKELIEQSRNAPAGELFKAMRPGFKATEQGTTKFSFGPIAGSAIGDVMGTQRTALGGIDSGDLGRMASLGGAGYVLGPLASLEPVTAALITSGLGARNVMPFLTKKTGVLASIAPPETGRAAGAMATQLTAPILGEKRLQEKEFTARQTQEAQAEGRVDPRIAEYFEEPLAEPAKPAKPAPAPAKFKHDPRVVDYFD